MGKGLIIFIAGMFIVMGAYQLTSSQRTIAGDKETAEQANRTLAHTNALSAIEMAAQNVLLDPAWAQSGEDFETEFPEGPARVVLTRNSNIYKFRAFVEANGVEAEAESHYLWDSEAFIPEIHGAMGIYSENLSFNVSGNAFSIDGNDYLTDGELNPDGVMTNGISVNNDDNKNLIEDELNNQQKNNIKGTGGTPSIGVEDVDIDGIENAIKFLSGNADEYYNYDYTASGTGSLGTPDDPKVIVVEGATLSLSNATGAGVIIVKDGGELDVRGNLDHYEGLIFVQGAARLVRGNVTIYGALVFGGEDPELEIDIDLRGNVQIRYSSYVIDYLNKILGARFSGTLTLLGHHH